MNKNGQRKLLLNLLGELPERGLRPTAKVINQDNCGGYQREKLLLELNGIEPVPAWFVKPATGKESYPVVLYNHWHGGQYKLGKDQLFESIAGSACQPWADELIEQGYAVLAIDHWAFGERSHCSESTCFKRMLWQGQVMWGMMVFDSLRAVDYLVSRPDIDENRIATLGMSMGSTMAWWLAALDERIKVCVDICCLTDFQALIENNGLDEHGVYYYVPGLLKHFTTTDINVLIAPRPHLALAGNLDPLTPPAGLDKLDRNLSAIYREAGALEAWKMLRYEVGHQDIPEMREAIVAFLAQWL